MDAGNSLGTATATFDLNITEFLSNADKAEAAMRSLDDAGGGIFDKSGHSALEFSDRLGEVGERIMGLGDRLYQSVSMPIFEYFSGAYGAAASLEQAFGKTEAVFVNNTDAVIAWSENSAEAFGLTQTEALQAAGNMGQIYQAMGMGEEQAMEMSMGFVQLAADMAAFNDVSTERSSMALRAALTGEYEGLKSLGIVLKGAEVEERALTIAMREGRTEVTELDRVMARSELINEKAALQKGQWAREMDGASGSAAILRAKLGDLSATVGRLFLPVITAATNVAIKIVDAISSLPRPVQLVIVVLAGLAAAAGPVLIALGFIISGVASLIPILAGLPAVLGAAKVALLGFAVNPVVLAGIAIIGAAILAFKTNFLGFGDLIRGVIGYVQDLWTALQVVFGNTHQTTANLDITTTTDNVWDQWVQQEDGTWKNATLDITSQSDDGALEYIGLDETTGKYMVMHISKDGEEIPGEILSSSQNPADPTQYFMQIKLEGGEEVTAIYDEVTGTFQILEDPAEMIVETEDATSNVEKLSGRVEKMIEWIEKANNWLTEFGEQFDALMTHDWENFDWRKMLDLLGLESLVGPIETIIDVYNTLESAVTDAYNAVQKFFGNGAQDKNNDGHTSISEQYDLEDIDLKNRGGNTGESTGVTRTPRTPSLVKSDGGGVLGETGNLAGRIAAVTEAYRLAEPAVTGFNNAIAGTSAPAQQAVIDSNLMASAVLPVGRNTETASSQVASAGGIMSNTFGSIAAVASSTMAKTAGVTSEKMGSVASSVVSKSSEANQAVTTQFGNMSTQAVAKVSGMQANTAIKMALMASTASTQGNAMMSNLVGAVAGGIARFAVSLAGVTAAVRSAGSSAAEAAYAAGLNIGAGFANGMLAYLGVIRGAASAMVSAAATAVTAKAMISSPSRLFKMFGLYIGEGLELGIRNATPGVANAAADMLAVPSALNFANSTPLGGSSGPTVIDNSTYVNVALTESDLNKLTNLAATAPERTMDLLSTIGSLQGA